LGIAGLALIGLFASCGGSKDKGVESTTSAAASETTAAPSDTSSGSSEGSPEAVTALTDALIDLGTTYHFVTTVRVDDNVVLTAEGDRVGGGVRLELTNASGSVSYIVTADGSWAKPENGTWAQLDVPAAANDPLAALVHATAATLGPKSGNIQVIDIEVPATELGIPGDGSAKVSAQVVDGHLDQVTYSTTENGQSAEVTTVFGTAKNTDPVVAPA